MGFDNSGSIDLGSAHGTINIGFAENEIKNALNRLDSTISGRLTSIGNKFSNMGQSLTVAFAPLTGFMAKGLLSFAEFDDILTEIQARTGSTAEQMELVRNKAIQMGQDTAFSASDASQAMLELLSSGYGLNETFAALEPTLTLAAAGGLQLGAAADAVTDILSQFRMEADQSGEVVDALNAASASSSATVQDLVDAFANGGAKAAAFGLSVEDVAAAFAVMAENGIKGSEAGTQFGSLLKQMSSDTGQKAMKELGVSLFDASGNARDFNDVIQDLVRSMDGMTQEEKIGFVQDIGGAYGQNALLALMAADGIETMNGKMDEQASAADVAAARMRSFRGVINQLWSSLETFSILVLEPLVTKYLKPAVEWVTQLINKFSKWATENPRLAEALAVVMAVLSVIGPTLIVLGHAIVFISGAIPGLVVVFGALSAVLGFVLSPIGLLIALLVGLGVAYQQNFMGFADAVDAVAARVRGSLPFIREQIEQLMLRLSGLADSIQNSFGRVRDNIQSLINRFRQMQSAGDMVGEVVQRITSYIQGLINPTNLLAGGFLGIAGKAMTLFRILSLVGAALSLLFTPIGLIVAALALLGVAWKTNFLGFGDAVSDVAKTVKKGLGTVLDLVENVADEFKKGGFAKGMEALQSGSQDILERFTQQAADTFNRFVGQTLPSAVSRLVALAPQLWGWIRASLPQAVYQIGVVAGQIMRFLADALITYGPTVLKGLVGVIALALTVGLPELLGLIVDMAISLIDGFVTGFTGHSFSITNAVSNVIGAVGLLFANLPALIAAGLPLLQQQLSTLGSALWTWIKDAVPKALEKLGGLIVSIGNWIIANGPSIAGKLLSWAVKFGEWVIGAQAWLLLKLGQLGLAMLSWIGEQAAKLPGELATWAVKFGTWLSSAEGQTQLATWWTMLTTWIGSKALALAAQFIGWGAKVVSWIDTAKTDLTTKLNEWWTTFSDWIFLKALELPSKFLGWADKLMEWLLTAKNTVGNKLDLWWGSISAWVVSKARDAASMFQVFKNKILAWIEDAKILLPIKLNEWYTTLKTWITDQIETIKADAAAIGVGIVDGLKAGINNAWQAFETWLRGKLDGLIGSILSIFDSHSPSKVMMDIGTDLVKGLQIGMSDFGPLVGTVRDMAGAMQMPLDAMMGGRMASSMASAGGGSLGQSQHNSIYVTVPLPPDLMNKTPEQAREIGSAFGNGMGESIMRAIRNRE